MTDAPLSTIASVTPLERLRALLAKYAALRTYRDRGVLRVRRPGAPAPLEMPFETLYAAPNRFRFEFHYPHPMPRQPATRYVVGSDGAQAYLLTAFPEQRPQLRAFPNLSRAVAAASGVSCGCAHTIARLLLSEVHGMRLDDVKQLEPAGAVQIGPVRCERYSGFHPYGGDVELAIGDDGLLHRFTKHSAGMDVEETRDAIEIAPQLDAAAFAAPRVT